MTSSASEIVEVEGHIIDSLILAKVLDVILGAGGDYRMLDVEIGRTNVDVSRARIEITAADDYVLTALVAELQIHGANLISHADAILEPAEVDGVLPLGFYATTNLPTQVRLGGHWVDVDNPEMDCALVVRPDGRARTAPMHRVRAGDPVVIGRTGVRVQPLDRPRGASPFEFMSSDVSSEKPKDQGGQGHGRQGAGRVRAGGDPHRRRSRRRRAGAGGGDRRRLRRQRLRHPRHRIERAGDVARRPPRRPNA